MTIFITFLYEIYSLLFIANTVYSNGTFDRL